MVSDNVVKWEHGRMLWLIAIVVQSTIVLYVVQCCTVYYINLGGGFLYRPKLLIQSDITSVNKSDIFLDRLKKDLKVCHDAADIKCAKAQQSYVDRYNLKSTPKSFEIGDQVLVTMPDSSNKLRARRQGPAVIHFNHSRDSCSVAMPGGAVRRLHADLLKQGECTVQSLECIGSLDLSYLSLDQQLVFGNLLLELALSFVDKPRMCNVYSLVILTIEFEPDSRLTYSLIAIYRPEEGVTPIFKKYGFDKPGLCNVLPYFRSSVKRFEFEFKDGGVSNYCVSSLVVTDEQRESFCRLKDRLCSSEVLAAPRYDRPFQIECDASEYAVGCCLSQIDDEGNERHIAFASSKLTDTQRRWSVLEKEGYAVVYALRQFDVLVFGSPVDVYCDHDPLQYMINNSPKSAKMTRWALGLARYDLRVHHKAGALNVNADCLSRLI